MSSYVKIWVVKYKIPFCILKSDDFKYFKSHIPYKETIKINERDLMIWEKDAIFDIDSYNFIVKSEKESSDSESDWYSKSLDNIEKFEKLIEDNTQFVFLCRLLYGIMKNDDVEIWVGIDSDPPYSEYKILEVTK